MLDARARCSREKTCVLGLPTHAPLPAGSCWLALRCTSCAPRSQHVRLKFTCPLLNATVYSTALRYRALDRRANVHSTRLTPQSTKNRGPASPAKRWQGILRKNVPGPTRVLLHTRGRQRRVYAQFRLGVRGAEAASKPARPRGSVRGRQLPRAIPQLRCAHSAAEKGPGVDRFLIHGSQNSTRSPPMSRKHPLRDPAPI